MNDLVPVPLSDIEKMATYAVNSKLFGVKSQEEAVALMLVAQSEGLHPMRAAMDFHIIQGRAALKSEQMLARFQAAGGRVRWTESTATVASAVFTHPAGGEFAIEWTIERATKIGLSTKDNWKNYPDAMLRARVVAAGVRAVLPGCLNGMVSTEEAEGIQPAEFTDVTPAKGVAALEKKLQALAPPPAAVEAKVAMISKEAAAEIVALAKRNGISEPAKMFQFVADNLEGKAITKLSELTAAEGEEIMLRLGEGDTR